MLSWYEEAKGGTGSRCQTEHLKVIILYLWQMHFDRYFLFAPVCGLPKITGMFCFFKFLSRTLRDTVCGQTVQGKCVCIESVKNNPEQILQMKVEVEVDLSVWVWMNERVSNGLWQLLCNPSIDYNASPLFLKHPF